MAKDLQAHIILSLCNVALFWCVLFACNVPTCRPARVALGASGECSGEPGRTPEAVKGAPGPQMVYIVVLSTNNET